MNAKAALSQYPHREASGDEVRINCPFCKDKVGKHDTGFHLYANTSKQRWICFRCGSSGGLRYLLKRLNVEVSDEPVWDNGVNIKEILMDFMYHEDQKQPITKPIDYPRWAVRIRRNDEAYKYLIKRKFTVTDIIHYRLRRTDDSIFIPFYENNMFVYWQTRGIFSDKKLNPPNSDKILGKSNYLFGHDLSVKADTIIIVEGWADAITVGPGAVSIQGKILSDIQAYKLSKMGAKRFVFFPDFDDKTSETTIDSANKLRKYVDVPVGFVDMYGKETRDPNDIGREKCWQYINNNTVTLDGKQFIPLDFSII